MKVMKQEKTVFEEGGQIPRGIALCYVDRNTTRRIGYIQTIIIGFDQRL